MGKKCGVQKQIAVERLAKCRVQDNLEVLQWCHSHFSQNFRNLADGSTHQEDERQGEIHVTNDGVAAPPGDHIDVQRRAELENMLDTLTSEMRERIKSWSRFTRKRG